jgi:hypothetical protein
MARGARCSVGHATFESLIGTDLATVAAFFDEPWSRFSGDLEEGDRAWLLSVAAYELFALGRLTEALQPMRAALDMQIQREDWENAARSARNLSELELTLGRLGDAVADARRSITYAGESGDAFQKSARRATAADALHQSGQRRESGPLPTAPPLIDRLGRVLRGVVLDRQKILTSATRVSAFGLPRTGRNASLIFRHIDGYSAGRWPADQPTIFPTGTWPSYSARRSSTGRMAAVGGRYECPDLVSTRVPVRSRMSSTTPQPIPAPLSGIFVSHRLGFSLVRLAC